MKKPNLRLIHGAMRAGIESKPLEGIPDCRPPIEQSLRCLCGQRFVVYLGASFPFDEQFHITRGLTYLRAGDLSLMSQHPPLIELLIALPLASDNTIILPLSDPSWQLGDKHTFSDPVLWRAGSDGPSIIARGRIAVIALTIILGLAIYVWSRKMFGPLSALLSVILPGWLKANMRQKVQIISSLLFLTLVSPALGTYSQERSRPMRPIVRQVDHIMILTRDPDSLYSFLVNLLELPVLYPYRPEAPGFKSGLLCAGNVNLEVIPSSPTPAREFPATFGNMAFEPNTLATSIAELKARQIEYAGPFPHVETDADGKQRTRWTNVGLRTLRGAFLCEYNFDVAGRRKTCQQELSRRGGGPIGLKRVKEIVLGVTELDDAIARWQKVLDPLRPAAPGFWRVGDGPALRLIQSDRASIRRLVLEVKSLDQAGGFLARHNLLGTHSKDKIKLDAKGVQGLDLHLVEAAP